MIPEILFSSDAGTIKIAGGTNPLLLLSFTEGLSLPEKEVSAAVFKNVAGQKLISLRDKPRKITFEGTVVNNNLNIAKLLYSDGTLTIRTDRMTRTISARCTYITDYTTSGSIKLIFECDSPYFHDGTDLKVQVYSRIELVRTPFTLPCVFTKRIREGNCKNESPVKCEPEIIIRNMGKNVINSFKVINTDTGASIEMDFAVNPGDTISINIGKRTVISGTGENLLAYLKDTCYLHEFFLKPGDNLIKLEAVDGLECEVIYNTNYTEAVI